MSIKIQKIKKDPESNSRAGIQLEVSYGALLGVLGGILVMAAGFGLYLLLT